MQYVHGLIPSTNILETTVTQYQKTSQSNS